MDRPSQDLLNEFYKVVSCERSDRLSSIKRFLDCEETKIHAPYIVERLIIGLSSPRAASRHGFSVALTLLLSKLPSKFSLEKLFEIADKSLDITLLQTSGGIIAYQLLCTCCYLSGAYNQEAAKLLKKQLELASAHSFLSACVADSIVKFSIELTKNDEGKSIFKQQILPQIRFKISKFVSDLAPDEFLLIAGLRPASSKMLSKECPLIKNKRLVLADSDFPALVEILKKADPTLKTRLILTILEIGRENGTFLDYFKNVFVEYAWHGDLSKAAERYFRLLNQICASPKIPLSELLLIFDADLIRNIRKYAHRSDPAFRGLHTLIQSFLERVQFRIDEHSCGDDEIQKLIFGNLELLDSVEGGEFDTKIGTQVKFSEFLIGKLCGNYFDRFLEKALSTKSDWSIRRFEHIYRIRNVSEKVKILYRLVEQAKSSEKIFEIVCGLLNGIFIIKFRRGECLGSALSSPDDIEVLKQVTAMTRGKTANELESDEKFECLDILACTLRILGAATNLAENRRDYLEAAREARRCARKYKCGALVDLLLSVLIHRNRVHKSLVFYVFCQLCASQHISAAEAKFIIDTIGKPDAEITGEGDAEDEDDDFKPITEAELKKSKTGKKTISKEAKESEDEENNEEDESLDEDEEMDDEEEGEESDDEDEEVDEEESDEEDEDDEENEEVDAKLVSDVKKALGSAALSLDANDEDDEMAEDENIENIDELHMKKLDAALADAFRRNSSKERKLRQEEIKTFRGKCLDLVNIFICLANCSNAREYQILCDSLSKAAKKLRQLRINEFQPKIESAIKSLTKKATKLEAQNA